MIDWEKALIYGGVFLALWFVLLGSFGNSFLSITLFSAAYHIHHSVIGLVVLALAAITWRINEEEYDWLVEVLLAVGASLIIQHTITEGFVFIT